MGRQRYTMTRRSRRPKSLLQSFVRYSSSFLISPILVAFFRGTGLKSIGRAHRTETEIATSTLLRIAFEYGRRSSMSMSVLHRLTSGHSRISVGIDHRSDIL